MELKSYIGINLIKSTPLSLGDYCEYMGLLMPLDKDPLEQGYLVEYEAYGKPNHPDHTGYISWLSKNVHEEAYRLTDGINFGLAIEAMKKGHKVARKGWNGSNMFAYYVPAASYPAARNTKNTMVGIFPDDLVPYRHYLALKTAQNDIATWAPSTSDALADDWYIVE